ncbi:MAG: hypothetical protein D6731_21785 [Planctomycetota bacterium]|nr:MAG: hypothetical protein D6731_21785 [Planctomycetota bacterium]
MSVPTTLPPARCLLALSLLLCYGLVGPAPAQEGSAAEPTFGFEFEFAGQGNRIVRFEDMPWSNYERLMRQVVEHYGGDPSTIRRVDFEVETGNLERYPSGRRRLFRAEWTDPHGRTWQIVPEFVASTGYDGYELVSPPLDDPRELEAVLERVRGSGLVREGLRSGVHLTVEGRGLVTPSGDARALVNLILLHENIEPALRRLFDPVRGGGPNNRFARSLAHDHPGLLEALDRLPPAERTRENVEQIFRRYQIAEERLQGVDAEAPATRKRPWKYRSLNLAKVLGLNPEVASGREGLVEFRMFDLGDGEAHRAQAEVYRRLVRRAQELAAEGVDVRYEPRAPAGPGGDWVAANTAPGAAEARAEVAEALERIGLEPERFRALIERNVRGRGVPSYAEAVAEADRLARGRPTHGDAPFTYGFELEGRGSGLVNIFRPTDAEVDARWDGMSEAERRAYYEQVVGNNHRSVQEHFRPNPAVEWLDPYWYVEGTGNWEIHSKVFESVDEVARAMREAKRLTRGSAKGFHLHLRDNGVDLEALRAKGAQFADFLERAGNWVWLERAARLRTYISMNTWSNARPNERIVDSWEQVRSSSRSTLRLKHAGPDYLDVEIRGLTLFVEDIERLARIVTEKLRTLDFGPWEAGDNRLETSRSLREHVEEILRETEGRRLTPEQAEVLDRFGTLGNAHTRRNLLTPFLPWEREAALPPTVRRELRFQKEDYARGLLGMADRVLEGRYGPPEAFDRAEVERQLRYRVKQWARSNGLREGLFASLLPRREAERSASFAPARRGAAASGPVPVSSERLAREVFEAVREAALERSRRTLEVLPPGPVADALREGQRRLRDARLELTPAGGVEAEAGADGRVRVGAGLLRELDTRARGLRPEERPAFRRRALGLVLAHELAHTAGTRAERAADAEAVHTLRVSRLARVDGVDRPLNRRELRETLALFERPAGASWSENLVWRLRRLARYGTSSGREAALRRAVDRAWRSSPPAREGLPLERAGSSERARAFGEVPRRAFGREGFGERSPLRGEGILGLFEGRLLRRAAERSLRREREARR